MIDPGGEVLEVSHGAEMDPARMELHDDGAGSSKWDSSTTNGGQPPEEAASAQQPAAEGQQAQAPQVNEWEQKYNAREEQINAFFARPDVKEFMEGQQGQQSASEVPKLAFKFEDAQLQEIGPDGLVRYSPEKMMEAAFNQSLNYLRHEMNKIVEQRFGQINPQLTQVNKFVNEQQAAKTKADVDTFVAKHQQTFPDIVKYATPGTEEGKKWLAMAQKHPSLNDDQILALIMNENPQTMNQVVNQRVQAVAQNKQQASIPASGQGAPPPAKEKYKFKDAGDLARQVLSGRRITHSGL